MTRASWDGTGGLPGLCLTLQGSGNYSLTLHGPDGLVSDEDRVTISDERETLNSILISIRQGTIFQAMQRFVNLDRLEVEAPKCVDGVIYDDEVMSVQAISFK